VKLFMHGTMGVTIITMQHISSRCVQRPNKAEYNCYNGQDVADIVCCGQETAAKHHAAFRSTAPLLLPSLEAGSGSPAASIGAANMAIARRAMPALRMLAVDGTDWHSAVQVCQKWRRWSKTVPIWSPSMTKL
jgi:hypothetical protein